MSEISKVAYQVMWNRLISVVEEQAQALIRTSFSTSVREAGDLSAGVYNEKGEMLAQAVTGTPGHVNAMADAVAHFIRRIGRENIAEGDVYITNNPGKARAICTTSPSSAPPSTAAASSASSPAPPTSSISAGAASARMPTRSTRKGCTSRS
ncbi:hypothetical protein BTHI11S_05815 [Bosea thiooxidans]